MSDQKPLTEHRDPCFWQEPDFSCLVNRKEQIETFARALLSARSSKPITRKNVLEWHGGPGIGKTTLLQLLRRECEKQPALVTAINFLEWEGQMENFLKNPTRLLELLLADLQPKQQSVLNKFEKSAQEYRQQQQPPVNVTRSYFDMSPDDRLYNRPEWLDRLNAIVIEFLNSVQGLTKQQGSLQPIVFMFDETESADLELADWLEEWVISPLSQIPQVIVVWTSRKPWRWKRPEVRRRLQSEELKPFEKDAVRDQLAAASSDALAQELFGNVHVLTGGHPFANAVILSKFHDWGDSITSETLDAHKAEIFELIFRDFIHDYVLRKFPLEVQVACALLALVRLFDTTMVRKILKSVRDDKFGAYRLEQFSDLMYDLRKTQLLVWEKGYAIDPNLRHLIQQYYAMCQEPTYKDVNDAALEVYRDWLMRPVDNRGTFVIEELYHLARKQLVGESIDLKAVLARRLQQYLEWFEDPEALRNALDMLKGELEHDKELNRLIAQLDPELSLAQVVQEFRDNQA